MDERSNETASGISDLRSRSPGADSDDPYEGTDVSELPDWWRRAIEEHREYGLRPYRPPRFRDGTLKHTVIEPIEDEYDVTIGFIDLDIDDDSWQIRIDGDIVGEIERRRSTEGYTVFEMEADEFERYIRSRIEN